MSARFIEILVDPERASLVQKRLDDREIALSRRVTHDGRELFGLLLRGEQVEEVLDEIEPIVKGGEGARVVVLKVEASLPRVEEEEAKANGKKGEEEKPAFISKSVRISRNELYENLNGLAQITPIYLATTVLATVVAAIGVAGENPAVIIGAMVIAPLLGPNMALALGTTLGDLDLIRRALRASLVGFAVTFLMALLTGLVWPLDPLATEVASRSEVTFSAIALAIASGAAGALAVTSGMSTSLVGVMVAVALLPPFVVATMLMVGGCYTEASQALLLTITNIICVNLSGVVTLYLRGVKPRTWWESARAGRATRRALSIWVGLLTIVVLIVLAELLGWTSS